MSKQLACIEISDDSIRFMSGNEVGGNPFVLYTKSVAVEGAVSGGLIIDHDALVYNLKEHFTEIQDAEVKAKISVGAISLVIPPLDLKVYTSTKETFVVGKGDVADNQIDEVDIKNVTSLLTKENIPSGEEIVEIIPIRYILESGQEFPFPPVKMRSKTLKVEAMIHTLPKTYLADYKKIVEETEILRIKRMEVSSYCLAEYIKTLKDFPESYILVDIGASISTISLVGKGNLYSSALIKGGSKAISDAIVNNFGVDFEVAEKLKKQFGYNTRQGEYNPPIARGEDRGGAKVDYLQKDLNAVIFASVSSLLARIDDSISKISSSNGGLDGLPIVFAGGGSKLNGLPNIALEKFPTHKQYFLKPTAIGARDAVYGPLLGVVASDAHIKGTLYDYKFATSTVTRESSQGSGKNSAPRNSFAKSKRRSYGEDDL